MNPSILKIYATRTLLSSNMSSSEVSVMECNRLNGRVLLEGDSQLFLEEIL